MQINNDTLYITFAPLIDHLQDGTKDELNAKAPMAVFGAAGFYSMTIAQFAAVVGNKLHEIFPSINEPYKLTLYEYITITQLPNFVEQYAKALSALTPQMTPDEERAQKSCQKVEPVEGLLLFIREFFGLKSFAEAEKITLMDVLLAKKDAYNKYIYQKAYSNIMNKKKR